MMLGIHTILSFFGIPKPPEKINEFFPLTMGTVLKGTNHQLSGEILLMAEIRRENQLRLVVFPIIYRVSYIQTVVGNGIS